MNSVIAIVLVALLAIMLIFLLRARVSSFSKFVEGMPRWLFFLSVIAIVCLLGFLMNYLFSSNEIKGLLRYSNTETVHEEDSESEKNYRDEIENCIILSGDEIWIKNKKVDWGYAKTFIDQHAESKTEIIIVDDYSIASLHNEITNYCKEKKVHYINKDEKWIK